MTAHVIPRNDSAEHHLDTQCRCEPTVETEDGILVIHNSFDGREFFEAENGGTPGKEWLIVNENGEDINCTADGNPTQS